MVRLEAGKSHIVTGEASQWQGPISREIALSYALHGLTVIEVVDRANDIAWAEGDIGLWFQARKLNPTSIVHRVVVATPDLDEMASRIMKAKEKASTGGFLIFRDLSTRTAPILPGNPWLNMAVEFASSFHIPVITATCDGHHRLTRPEPSAYKGAVVFEVSEPQWNGFGYAERGVPVNLRKVWPNVEPVIKLQGESYPGIVVFNEKELEHA